MGCALTAMLQPMQPLRPAAANLKVQKGKGRRSSSAFLHSFSVPQHADAAGVS
jgi:hypothetical protein